MKKLLLAVLLFATSFGFGYAHAATVYGKVGVESNYINKGVSLSKQNPSLFGQLGIKFQNGLFAKVDEHTVDRADNTHNRTSFTAGYTGHIAGLKYYGDVSRVVMSKGLHTNVADHEENHSSVDIGAEYKGVFADATKDFQVEGGAGKDLWYRAGYKFHPVSKLLVGAALTRKHYEHQGVTVSRGAEAFATYAWAKNVDVNAEYWTNVRAADGSRLGNQSSVGVALKF